MPGPGVLRKAVLGGCAAASGCSPCTITNLNDGSRAHATCRTPHKSRTHPIPSRPLFCASLCLLTLDKHALLKRSLHTVHRQHIAPGPSIYLPCCDSQQVPDNQCSTLILMRHGKGATATGVCCQCKARAPIARKTMSHAHGSVFSLDSVIQIRMPRANLWAPGPRYQIALLRSDQIRSLDHDGRISFQNIRTRTARPRRTPARPGTPSWRRSSAWGRSAAPSRRQRPGAGARAGCPW